MSDQEKCPKCGGEVAYYQAMELGYVGCKANEGYPGAAHDRLTVNNRLRDLVNKWYGNACIIGACMGDDHPAAKAMLRCRAELCEATGESVL